MGDLLGLFPREQRGFWRGIAERECGLQEIRLRAGRPILVTYQGREYFVDKRGALSDKPEHTCLAETGQLSGLLQHICHYSIYAFEEEIRQGYLTVPGGHRIGLAGQTVLEENGSIRTLKHISYMNIRIAHEWKGVADEVLPRLYRGGRLCNTLIVSPPGCGKTTLLRDLIRQISDGNKFGHGQSVGVVDERSEIAGSYLGVPQLDVGMRTDVLDACPKALGMMLLLRSMAPRVLAVDELGGEEDLKALSLAASCGSSVLVTMHGEGLEDAITKLNQGGLLEEHFFQRIVVLGKEAGIPKLVHIYGKEEIDAALAGRLYDRGRESGAGALVP